MSIKFNASFLKNVTAFSNSVKKQVMERFGKKSGFPQEESQVDELLKHIDSLIPNETKAKAYTLFLCSQLFDLIPPGLVLGEDDARVKPLLADYDKAVQDKKITGPKANIEQYKTLEDLQKAVEEISGGSKKNLGTYNEEQLAAIKAGAKVVLDSGGWVVYEVPKGNKKESLEAAKILCDNPLHGVSWCVGRGAAATYVGQGNFYVLEQDGNSKYAISTDSNSATIWNPADTPVWSTSGTSGKLPNLSAAAKTYGIDVDLSGLSALPQEIIPVLKAVGQKDKYLADRIPSENLIEGDFTNVDKLVYKIPGKDLIADLNAAFSSARSAGLGAAILGRAIKTKKDLKDSFSQMSDNTITAYIELLAANGYKSLPTDFEDFIVSEIEKSK